MDVVYISVCLFIDLVLITSTKIAGEQNNRYISQKGQVP